MKAKKITLLALLLANALIAKAQYVPTHGQYVDFSDSKKFYQYFKTWEPGKEISEDENFFISRIKIKDRFINRNTQVIPDNEMNNNRKFCLFTPMGISDTYWQTLPRYVFDGDNFGMWSYVDYQGGWSQSWIRTPGAYSDVCHKNGVANSGGVVFVDSWGGDNTEANEIFRMITEQNPDGTFKYLEKFIKFMKYYGVDGLGVNPEGTVVNAPLVQDFFAQVFEKAPEYDWHFHVYWYGTNSNGGSMDLGSTLTSSKSNWFIKNGKTVTDMYFLNYSWDYSVEQSVSTAENLRKGSSYDVFAGYDIQGNWLGRASWKTLAKNPISIVFWGNHTTDMIYQNSSEYGSNDEAVQYCYLDKQEQVFSGGNQNPANTPVLADGITGSSTAAMKKFHGIAALMPAKSSLQELPFITRFTLGNGKVFRDKGEVTFNHKWYNIASQDYLPTWRWWITNDNNQVPSDPIKCTFTFEDSWFAGSCMRVYGKTAQSNVRLFKTNFKVAATDNINLIYKINSGKESHMKLFWSFVGSEDQLHYYDIPNAANTGEWTNFTAKALKMGIKGEVALLGIKFENTDENYEVLLGELGIVPNKVYTPATPTITIAPEKIFLNRTYNSLDFKLIWKSKDQDPNKLDIPIYNEDVDTWYFEIWSQPRDGKATLCGITTSWAHYVVGAPSDPYNKEYRVGVRAVAPDGKTFSDFSWSDYQEVEAGMVEGIEIDKPIIKSGEEFTLKFKDPLHAEAGVWNVRNAITGDDVTKGQVGGTSYTLSIAEEGYYDVILTDEDNNEMYYRGFIQISPEETGALPLIKDFTANPTEVNNINPTTNVTYEVERLGEGKVSRGLEIADPYMFRIPSEALPADQKTYSIGLWVKPTKFSHSKYGTNLLNKRDVQISWPNNNWGAFWVHIWPETKNSNGNIILNDNIVSYTMYNNESKHGFQGNSNKHEIPNLDCCTDGNLNDDESYGLGLEYWSHILISYDGSNQRIYFNGKKVGETRATLNSYNECPVYVGGSNVYHSGFVGVIDDVQVWNKALSDAEVVESMAGYDNKEIPSELVAYWTFEDFNKEDSTFVNKGHGGSNLKGKYIEFDGAAGEATAGTVEKTVYPNNSVLGNPALPGTMEIKTSAKFIMPGASVVNTPTGVTATYDKNGKYDVTLALSNMWGSTSMTKQEYIVATNLTGVNNEVIENFSIYPNPFVEAVNVIFPEEGNYSIRVYTIDGSTCLDTESFTTQANETKRIAINGEQGMYLIQILRDGRCIKTVKLNKKQK